MPRLVTLAAFTSLAAMLGTGSATAGTLSTLHQFTGGADGATPYKGVTLAGTTIYGTNTYGANICADSYFYANVGCGVLYKQTGDGTFTTLVTFLGASNGASPNGNVTVSGTTIYGTTYTGGSANQGTVFQVKTNGRSFKTLYSFSGTDGAHPNSFPRLDAGGNIYSVAQFGGPGYNGTDLSGSGTLFKIDTSGHWTAQHYFSGGADGGQPGRLFIDPSGLLLGATDAGGTCTVSSPPANGCGTIYSFDPVTATFTTLYSFTGGTDGYEPLFGGEDSKGNLYGTTPYGGTGYGTLFELVHKGAGYTYKLLYSFTGGADGAYPFGPPAVAKNGELTGTTFEGPIVGSNLGAGTLFQFSKGTLTTLATFVNDGLGGYPEGTPVVQTGGSIIGTTVYGGISPCDASGGTVISSFGCGTIYKYSP